MGTPPYQENAPPLWGYLFFLLLPSLSPPFSPMLAIMCKRAFNAKASKAHKDPSLAHGHDVPCQMKKVDLPLSKLHSHTHVRGSPQVTWHKGIGLARE